MPLNRRDDFSQSVIRTLRNRVNNTCSNPDCKRITQGPHSDPNKANSTGVAAHISAAASGGPRFDVSLTASERKSIENAIWLCGLCEKKIDRDPVAYPVRVLQAWKAAAEAIADRDHGTRLYRSEDMQETLKAGLTGFSRKPIANAIRNIHSAYASALEDLDPRLTVSTAFDGRSEIFSLRARNEAVPFNMTLHVDPAVDITTSFDRLIQVGQDVALNTKNVRFDGSPLLEELTRIHSVDRLTISSIKKDVKTRTWLVSPEGLEVPFDDFPCKASTGTAGIQVNGKCFNGLLGISYEVLLSTASGHVTLAADLKSWDERDVASLPYFDNLHTFFDRVAHGWGLRILLEHEGRTLVSTSPIQMSEHTFVQVIHEVLRYTESAIALSKVAKSRIGFQSEFPISNENFKDVVEAGTIALSRRHATGSQIKENPSMQVVLAEGASRLLETVNDHRVIRICERDGCSLIVFGQIIDLPPRTISFEKFLVKSSVDLNLVEGVEPIPLELVRAPDSKIIWGFDTIL